MPSLVLRRSIVEPKGPFLAEPQSVRVVGDRVEPQRADIFIPEMVPRNCTLEDYKKIKVPNIDVESGGHRLLLTGFDVRGHQAADR